MICENCDNEHDGRYASGRFCCQACSRSFSTKIDRNFIRDKISKSLIGRGNPNVTLECSGCGSDFTVEWSKRNQKHCSISCSITRRNRNSKLSNEHRNNISNGVKKNYENGKEVYGGRTKWYEYGEIKVQGSYELRACHILDEMKKTGKIHKWEYTRDRIPYKDIHNKNRMYLIDFKIYESEKDFYYLETKGYVTENDHLKWNEARKKYKLNVWFNKDLKNMEISLGIRK